MFDDIGIGLYSLHTTRPWEQVLLINEREILFNSVAAIINIQPTNDMFLRILTSRDITVVKSPTQFIYGCFKQIKG